MTVPASAVTIWLRDQQILMQIPSTVIGGQSHTLAFDNNLIGRARVFTILHERANEVGKLSTRSAPTQAQLRAFDKKPVTRRAVKPSFHVAPTVTATAKEVLRKLGVL